MKKYLSLFFFCFGVILLLVFYDRWRLGYFVSDRVFQEAQQRIVKERKQAAISQQEADKLYTDHSTFTFPWKNKKTSSSESPLIRNQVAYGEILTDSESTQTGEISRYYDSGEDVRFAKVKGYAHYYIFSDFGISLGTNTSTDSEFFEEHPQNLFLRYKDSYYDVIYKPGTSFYVQKFQKTSQESFDENLLQKNNAVTGCQFMFSEYNKKSVFDSLYKVYQFGPISYENGQSYCDTNLNDVIYFVYNPQHPTQYYKVSWHGGCAPSCGIPTEIRL